VTPSEQVIELFSALRDCRLDDLASLAHPQVIWEAVVRPGLSVYHGHDGLARLARDAHSVHGDYQFTADVIAEDLEPPGVTMLVRIILEPGRPVETFWLRARCAFRDGLIEHVETELEPS